MPRRRRRDRETLNETATVAPLDLLAARIRGEFDEMPGLRLTHAQACRLWQVDPVTCHAVLQRLLSERFLVQTSNGTFMALSPRLTPARASLESSRAAAPPSRFRKAV
jgi:hypothetical protein